MVQVHRPRFFPFVAWLVEHSPTKGSVLQSLPRERDFDVINPRLGLTYPASQHISRAIYLHKLPRFSVGDNIFAPHQIKLSSSNSCWSLSSVKQPGELPGYVRYKQHARKQAAAPTRHRLPTRARPTS